MESGTQLKTHLMLTYQVYVTRFKNIISINCKVLFFREDLLIIKDQTSIFDFQSLILMESKKAPIRLILICSLMPWKFLIVGNFFYPLSLQQTSIIEFLRTQKAPQKRIEELRR